jgi:acyl-CoA thioesterase FadM
MSAAASPAPPTSATEWVESLCPFTVRRVARWADCDPAGVVHTPRFGDYVLSATDLFRAHLIGPDWHRRNREAGFGSPAKALSLVFQGSLWPGDAFDIEVYAGEIRTRTMDLLLRARRAQTDEPIFMARLSSICVRVDDRRESIAWSGAYADQYRIYRETAPPPVELAALGP